MLEDFKDCVEEIEVSHVNYSVLKFTWNQNPKGNVHLNVKKLRFELDKVQCDLDSDPFNISLREEDVAYLKDFDEAFIMEERFLKQKAKIGWLRGDQVPVAFVSHYASFLGQHGVTLNLHTYNPFTNNFASNVACDMIKTVTPQEVKDATFSIRDDKSPERDGYTAVFFKEAWDNLANDVTKAVQELFINDALLKELNHTIIALIPKVASPSRELMHNYHLDCGPPRCAFKVDIQEAYDMVDWDFLKDGKRGLRQGDPMSPYLLTLIMEVFTLMLHREVRESESFTYHPYCSNLDIINLCFVDDLFLFSHGNVNLAWVIMEALDEFK
nr:hypothetical protein [Tanacetum cinerariifolium]